MGVALYMSAWIEIYRTREELNKYKRQVALYMSAWIEIYQSVDLPVQYNVALYMSAWIEIYR